MNNIEKESLRFTIFKRLIYFALAFVPLLDVYASFISFVSVGEFILIISTFFLILIEKKYRIKSIGQKSYDYFFLYLLGTTLICLVVNNKFVNLVTIKEIISVSIYFILFKAIIRRYDKTLFLKCYRYVAFVAASFLILQYIIFLVTGEIIPGIISGVESSIGLNTTSIISRIQRPSSFFTEPAHFSQYISIPLVFSVFEYKKNIKNNVFIIISIIGIIITRTGNGVVVLSAIIFVLFLSLIKKKRILAFLISVGIIAIIILLLYRFSKTFQSIIGRVAEITGNYGAGHYSGYIRVTRGYIAFSNLNFLEKLFGLGIGIYHQKFITDLYPVLTEKTSLLIDYVNGIQFYLISTGIIGIILFFISIFKATRSRKSNKAIACVLIALMFVSAIYTGWMWLYFLMMIFYYSPKEEEV